jgi:hypothetical protein
VAEFIAAAEENLTAGSSQQLGESGIDSDSKVTAWVAAVRHLILFKNGSERHESLENELLSLFW